MKKVFFRTVERGDGSQTGQKDSRRGTDTPFFHHIKLDVKGSCRRCFPPRFVEGHLGLFPVLNPGSF